MENSDILVASVSGPLDNEFDEGMKTFSHKKFDWEKIKNACGEFYLFYSDNDPYECGIENGRIIHKKLGGKLLLKTGEGHFNLEKGPQYKQFPELLKYI